MDGDRLLERIATVCGEHEGNWVLHFASESGGAWSMTLSGPPAEETEMRPTAIPFIMKQIEEEPIFAMKCQELEVIVVALEHWHAASAIRNME